MASSTFNLESRAENIFDENVSSIEFNPSDSHATFYLLPNGIGKDRRTIFTNALQRFQLQSLATPENARFIITDDQFDVPKIFQMLKIESHEDAPPTVIRTKWLSDSLKEKRLIPLTKDYIIRPPFIRKQTVPSFTQESTTEEKKFVRDKPKRKLSEDEPQGGCATQIKQRRFSSDDDDYDVNDVRIRVIRLSFSIEFSSSRIITIL